MEPAEPAREPESLAPPEVDAAQPPIQPLPAPPVSQPVSPPANTPAKRARRDPYAHRRGEPRTFAILWMVYMVAAIVVSLSPVGAAGLLSVETYRPSARLLAALMATGVAVVWPMVRLSQIRPKHPARAISQDLVIVMVPIAAMCAAQAAPWMAGWPWPVGLALALGILGWALLVGGIILHALASEAARQPAPAASQGPSQPLDPDSGVDQQPVVGVRVLAMLVLMALAAVGPVVAAIAYTPWHSVRGEPGLAIDWAMMSSPVGFALEVTRDRVWTGWSAAIGVRHWLGVAVIGVLGVSVLVSARARARRI